MTTVRSDSGLECQCPESLRNVVDNADDVTLSWMLGDALVVWFLALGLGISKNLRVDLHPLQKLLPACRMPNVLNADVDALLKVPVADDLAENNSYSTGSDVEDDTSFAMVELVGHATLDGWIRLNVHQVANPVCFQVSRDMGETLGLEFLLEQMASSCAVTV